MIENTIFINFQRHSQVRRSSLAMFTVAFLVSLAFHAKVKAEDKLTPTKLVELTELRQQEISTAKLTLLYSSSRAKSGVAFDEAVKQLKDFHAQVATETDPATVAVRLSGLLEGVAGRSSELPFPKMQIIQKGDQVRNIVEVNGEPRGDFSFSRGVSSMFRNGANTVTLDAGKSIDKRYTIFDIRPVLESPDSWQVVDASIPPDHALLQMALSPQPNETAVYQSIVDSSNGNVSELWLEDVFYRFRGPFVPVGPVSLPQTGVDLYFNDGLLKQYFAFALIDGSINDVVADEDLITTADKGVRVVDARDPSKVVRVYSTHDNTDPVQLADAYLDRQSASRPKNARFFSYYAIATCFATALLLVFVFRRVHTAKD